MLRLRCAVAAAVTACLLVACNDDEPEPKVGDPTPSTSSSAPTVSTSPTETQPAELDPEQTVQAWVDARNRALQDGDTAEAEALVSDSCETCNDSLQPIRDVYAQGGHFETTGWTVLASQVEDESATKAKVSAGIEYAAGQTFPEAGSDPVIYEAEKHVVVFRLIMESGSWRLSFIGYLS